MSADVDNASNVLLLVYGTYTRVAGFRINWVLPDSESSDNSEAGNPTLALNNAIQNVILPHGRLTADREAIYFTHASRNGVALIKRRSSSLDDDVHIESLAVISPTPFSSQPQTWHYLSDLRSIFATCWDAESTRQAAKSWYSTQTVRRIRTVRILDIKTVTWEEQLADSAYHPLHNLPFFLRLFGPSLVTLYKYVLARMRVVIYVPPALPTNSETPVFTNADLSGDPGSSLPKPTDASPLLTRPCELASSLTHILSALCGGKDRPYALGFLGEDVTINTLFDQPTGSVFGWIACTADKQLIYSRFSHIDLVVDLSPLLNSAPLSNPRDATVSNVSDGTRSPLLLIPSSSSSPATVEHSLEVRPTRFTLLDIQLWSAIQSVMKRIERAKQRLLRSHERGRQGMNGTSGHHRNGNSQGRSNISDSEDWDDGDLAVPGGWNVDSSSQHLAKSSADPADVYSSILMKVQKENTEGNGFQPPQLPQKSTYTLDLITAFHRHVVSLSKSYATMATTATSSLSTTVFFPSVTAKTTATAYLPSFEFDDLEKAFLEGGRRRRGSSLNGMLNLTSEMKTDTSFLAMSPTITSTYSSDTVTESASAIISPTVTHSDTEAGAQLQKQLHSQLSIQSSKVTSSFNTDLLPSLSSPPRNTASAGSLSRSSSPDSARTPFIDADAQLQPDSAKASKHFSELHATLGLSSSAALYSPPPYPYVFPSTYPKRPDTVTSFASIPTSQFVTPEHSPILTARNSPVEIDSPEGTPIAAAKEVKLDNIEPLNMLQPTSPTTVVYPQAGPSPLIDENAEAEHDALKRDVEENEKMSLNESDKAKNGDDGGQSRNSISFPSAVLITPPAQPTPQNTVNATKPKTRFFWHRKSLSDDVSSNLHVPSKTGTTTPPQSGRESPATLKKRRHASTSSAVLPTDLQILEVEAELREQEARMLAPSPTPPALVSPELRSRKVKGWSVPAEFFLGDREKKELAKDGPGDDDDGKEDVSKVVVEAKAKAKAELEGNVDDGVDNNNVDVVSSVDERNLVLTPVEVLWERRREASVSPPPPDTSVSVPVPPPSSDPLPAGNSSSVVGVPQPLLQPHLFSPQPLPPGAANPSPNVGAVITSIIDVLRGAIALHGDTASVAAASYVNIEDTLANAQIDNVADDPEPPLTPPPPLLTFSNLPVRTPTPQSGRGTPRGLPKIDEEEEEGSVVSERSVDGGANSSMEIFGHEGQTAMDRRLRHVGHATDSGDAADAEGADGDGDGDGETGSMSSSVTAAGLVPPGLGFGLGSDGAVISGVGASSIHGSTGMGMDGVNTPSSSPAPPSPGFLSMAGASASSPSILLPPSPLPFGPSPSSSPSLSPSNGIRVSPSPSPRPERADSSALPNTKFTEGGMAASKKSSSSSSKSIPTSPSPQRSSKKGHGTTASMSNPTSPTPSSSIISNLTKSLSLTIRPRRLSLLSSSSSSNGKRSINGAGGVERQDVAGGSASGLKKKKKDDDVNLNSRSAPSTLSSTNSSNLFGGLNTSSSSPPSASPSNSSSPTLTTPPNVISSGGGWIKRSRTRTRPASTLPDSAPLSSNEPAFNMVTLMSAEEARSLGVEEWNGRNSGVGTLALAHEMRRAQAESTRHNNVATALISDPANENGFTAMTVTDTGANESVVIPSSSSSSSSPAEPKPSSALSSSKNAPPPKKGILRGRRASLTALPPIFISEEKSVTEAVRAISPSSSLLPTKQNQKSKSTPILKLRNKVFNEASTSASTSVQTPKTSLERKGSGASSRLSPLPLPPPPPLPPSPLPDSTSPRPTTPDSTRRKLRKRRKSLIESSGTNITNIMNLVESKPLPVPA